MLSIGIDAVEISRFKNWNNYKKSSLLKIFQEEEIDYCLKNENKFKEKLASHFAVKEAFYKALSSITKKQYPFLFVCKNMRLTKKNCVIPSLEVNWENFDLTVKTEPSISLSLTHSKLTAFATVIIN